MDNAKLTNDITLIIQRNRASSQRKDDIEISAEATIKEIQEVIESGNYSVSNPDSVFLVKSSDGGDKIDECSYDQYYRNLENLRKFSQKNPNLQSFTLYIGSYKSYLKPNADHVNVEVKITTATLDQFFKDNQIFGWTEEE